MRRPVCEGVGLVTVKQGGTAGHEEVRTPAGRTRWWMVGLILGLPMLLVAGFLAIVVVWVLTV